MPSIIAGPINLIDVSGTVNFGDSFYIAPKSSSKTSAGSGGFNTGNIVVTNNGISTTNEFDPDVNDQQTIGTN